MTLVSTFVNLAATRAASEDQLRTSGMSGAQLDQALAVGVGVTLGVTIVLVGLYILAAVGALRGWTWSFWLGVVLLGLNSIFAVTGLIGLVAAGSTIPLFWRWLGESLQLLGLTLFVWALVAATRFGPWARTKPRT